MPRTSSGPRYYKSKKGWFATLGGATFLLIKGPKKETEKQAQELYDAEVAARKVEVQGDRNIVWTVLNAYLLDLRNRVQTGDAAPSLLEMHDYFLASFNARIGRMPVRELRPQHLNDWLAAMRQERWNEKLNRATKWSRGTEKLARAVVNRAFNWAVGEAGLISAHPLKRQGAGPKAKRRKRRPSENRVAITPREHLLLTEQASRRSHKGFLHLITFLRRTGARPAEMYGVTASEWDATRNAFRIRATPENYGRYKLAHLGEDRLVYVPDELLPLLTELMATYPSGPLFRNERDTPWNVITICSRFTSIKNAANRASKARGEEGIRKEVTAYSYRHAFVTEWVESNKPLPVLCELLNTSMAMVKEHYSHLFERPDALRGELNSFKPEVAAPPANPVVGPAA